MATKCIVCKKDRKGLEVYDDLMIRSIRRVKTALNMVQNNKLVVCTGCMGEHLKRRKTFEKWLVIYGAVGLSVMLIVLLMSPDKLKALLLGLFLLALMVLLSVVTYYHPSLKNYPKEGGKGKRAGK
jgi:predicted RND superfamily exporter protein